MLCYCSGRHYVGGEERLTRMTRLSTAPREPVTRGVGGGSGSGGGGNAVTRGVTARVLAAIAGVIYAAAGILCCAAGYKNKESRQRPT